MIVGIARHHRRRSLFRSGFGLGDTRSGIHAEVRVVHQPALPRDDSWQARTDASCTEHDKRHAVCRKTATRENCLLSFRPAYTTIVT
jgi:hypothetical protein